jgi:hypothetical protein
MTHGFKPLSIVLAALLLPLWLASQTRPARPAPQGEKHVFAPEESHAPTAVHVGLGMRPFGSATGQVVFIQRDQGGSAVFAFNFNENPEISEMALTKIVRRASVSVNASDAASPWRNTPFFDELLQWIVWREGRSIKALSSVMSAPLSTDLSAEPAYLVHPPLKTKEGPVEVLAISHDRTEISLIEFSSSAVGENPSAKVFWKNRLPAAPEAITAALAPISQQSARHIAFVVQRQSGFEIFHARYSANGLDAFHSVQVAKGRLLPHVSPSLFIDDAGLVKFGILAAPDEHAHACTFVEAEFDISGKSVGDPKLTSFDVAGPPATGAVLYSQNQGQPVRRDVVVAVKDHGIVHLDHEGHMSPALVQGTPVAPIQLAPGQHSTYVLYINPQGGLYFEPLE